MKIKPGLIVAISLCLVALGELGILPTKLPSALAFRAEGLAKNTKINRIKQNFNRSEINRKLILAHTKFSFKLFSEIQQKEANKNIFISPVSLAIALSMAYNGANGKTQEAIAQTLELEGISLEELNLANAALKANLVNIDPKVELLISNSFWVQNGEPLKPEFKQIIQQFYSSGIKSLNFGDVATALSIINSWVDENTNHKINKIIDDIQSNTVFILLNAISFNGTWKYPFSKQATENHSFTLLNGDRKIQPMMFQEIFNLPYYENELFQAISLPYGNGRLSMYIFLPKESITLQKFYKNLNAKNWEEWVNYLNNNDNNFSELTSVGLPRFKLEYEIDLVNTLKNLGMEIAFTGSADFSRMTPSPLSISLVKQKTFLEVNEEGTQAAAASVVVATRGVGNKIIIDRPFFCAIRDNQTGVILFMGSIVEPQ